MSKRNIAIVAGGDSSEVVVSLKSADGIASFFNHEQYNVQVVIVSNQGWYAPLANGEQAPIDKNDFSYSVAGEKHTFDFAYITIHGTPGEDGKLQGYFDLIEMPYSCCGVLAAALTFNKFACNHYLRGHGIRVAPSVVLHADSKIDEAAILAQVGLPCFVKPNGGGSSFGTTKVKEASELKAALDAAFGEAGNEVIVEAFMAGTEITCGCYKTAQRAVVLPITEVVSKNEFFDYEAKYTSSMVEEITPARISQELTEEVQRTTSHIYDLLRCKGIARIDYIIVDGVPHLLEVNTTPGMTVTSFIPQQVAAAGMNMGDVLAEIVENELAKG